MQQAKIVIGANFGDEGKGMMTDYFAHQALQNKKTCLVICHNGGAQKGHTVVSPEGKRHVFHHFGAGTMAGAATYLASTFIVNPILFNKEWEELMAKNLTPQCFLHPHCRLTTPFEMMINQLIEEMRNEARHGSCGLGIFETIKRHEHFPLTVQSFDQATDQEKEAILLQVVHEQMPKRLKALGIETLPPQWQMIIEDSKAIIHHYIQDFNEMMHHVTLKQDTILEHYDTLIFEGAQGLLLDEDCKAYSPHLTPSHTGLYNPAKMLKSYAGDIEVCYVTRTYMTRHGAGRFDTECPKEQLSPKLIDETNVPNPYQQTLRYGHLEANTLYDRIQADYQNKLPQATISLAITQVDQYDKTQAALLEQFQDWPIYISKGKTYKDISYMLRF